MRHLIDLITLSKATITTLLDKAELYKTKYLDTNATLDAFKGKIIANLFFESSTRTLLSFQIAAHRLGAIVLTPNMKQASTLKGESLLDTIHTLEAMGTDLFVVRHTDNNVAQFIASELHGPTSIINAGDGNNHHPTQALLDLMTIRQHKQQFETLTVAIVGDIIHSRVARSLVTGLKIMGVKQLNLTAPKLWVPDYVGETNIKIFNSLTDGLADVDVIIALRIQRERIQDKLIPNPEKYFQEFGITAEKMTVAKNDAIVMHPGPMNRGVEIDSQVADGAQSVILQQVSNGVAMRMAIMDSLLG